MCNRLKLTQSQQRNIGITSETKASIKEIKFSLRELVHTEIRNLEKQEIIEDVISEATPWLSQFTIVPKQGNKIRLCIDMDNANTAINKTKLPTPTVDDLSFRLKNAQYFTKLDLNGAFHRLE